MAKKDTKTGGPRELDRAGSLCLAFANMSAAGRDDRRRDGRVPLSKPLAGYAHLVSWAQRMGTLAPEVAESLRRAASERPEDSAAVLARAAGLSAALLRIFTAVALGAENLPEDVAILNRVLRKREVIPDMDGFRRGWLADEEAPDRVLWPVAESAAELLASDRLRKVRQCASAGCSRLFVYINSRRRWCDENTCGNRAKGRRYNDMVRRAKTEAEARTYHEINEEREQRMEELKEESEEIRKKNERLRKILEEAKAMNAAGRPVGPTGGQDTES